MNQTKILFLPSIENCEDTGEGYECLDFDECDPDTFLAKDEQAIADNLFQKRKKRNLLELNLFGDITVNTDKSPCKNPVHLCCKKNKVKVQPPPAPVRCGVHNQFGLKRGGVGVSFSYSNGKPVTSQEGEWPHTCLILKIDKGLKRENLLGGASLIAPKVIVTAAHIVRYEHLHSETKAFD